MNVALGYQIPFKLIPSIKASLTKALLIGSKAWLKREQTSPPSTKVNCILVKGAQLWGPQSNDRGGSTTTGTHMRWGGRRVRGFRHWGERQILNLWCRKGEWQLPQYRERRKKGPHHLWWKPSGSWNKLSKVFCQPQEMTKSKQENKMVGSVLSEEAGKRNKWKAGYYTTVLLKELNHW